MQLCGSWLRKPSTAHVPQPSQFRLIHDDTIANQLVKRDGQGHEPQATT